MSVDETAFRNVMGTFATGVTIVTFPEEPPHGMTANAFSSVSLDPPLCLVCVDHDTHTYELLSEGDIESFAVNILARSQQDLAEHFANMTELEDDPFEARPTDASTAGAPIFTDSLAYVDCTVEAVHPAGDHTIYVGRAEDAEILDAESDPLTFFRGQWGTTAEG